MHYAVLSCVSARYGSNKFACVIQISMLEYRDKLYNEILKRKKEQRRLMKGREKEAGISSSSRTRSTRHARNSDGSRYR